MLVQFHKNYSLYQFSETKIKRVSLWLAKDGNG